MIIKKVAAKAIVDSRGEKTIEVSVNGSKASSPSGKSTGMYETPQYNKNLKWNIDFLNKWSESIKIESFDDLARVEEHIRKKAKLKEVTAFGANALFAFESALLKALAREKELGLWQVVNPKASRFPIPVGNAIGGGLHSDSFKEHPTFQEFLLIPKETSPRFTTQIMRTIYTELSRSLNAKKTNDEGAWHTPLDDEGVLKVLSQFTSVVSIGVDIAASSFYNKGLYSYKAMKRTREAHLEHILKLMKEYGVFYIEDPVEQEDFRGFAQIRNGYKEGMVVGDDLTATHLNRVKKAVESRSISAMIVKPNQNGSLVQVKEIISYCKEHNIKTIMSHRSGETMDDALADYAFGFGTDYIKCGIATKWREAKLTRLVEIESGLASSTFA